MGLRTPLKKWMEERPQLCSSCSSAAMYIHNAVHLRHHSTGGVVKECKNMLCKASDMHLLGWQLETLVVHLNPHQPPADAVSSEPEGTQQIPGTSLKNAYDAQTVCNCSSVWWGGGTILHKSTMGGQGQISRELTGHARLQCRQKIWNPSAGLAPQPPLSEGLSEHRPGASVARCTACGVHSPSPSVRPRSRISPLHWQWYQAATQFGDFGRRFLRKAMSSPIPRKNNFPARCTRCALSCLTVQHMDK